MTAEVPQSIQTSVELFTDKVENSVYPSGV